MSNLNKVKRHMLFVFYDEPTGLWCLLSDLRFFCPEMNREERRVDAIKIIREMMDDGLIIAGLPGKEGFDRWEGTTDEVIKRIEREWDEILKEDDSEGVAFVWFATTEKGDIEGKKIEAENMKKMAEK